VKATRADGADETNKANEAEQRWHSGGSMQNSKAALTVWGAEVPEAP